MEERRGEVEEKGDERSPAAVDESCPNLPALSRPRERFFRNPDLRTIPCDL